MRMTPTQPKSKFDLRKEMALKFSKSKTMVREWKETSSRKRGVRSRLRIARKIQLRRRPVRPIDGRQAQKGWVASPLLGWARGSRWSRKHREDNVGVFK